MYCKLLKEKNVKISQRKRTRLVRNERTFDSTAVVKSALLKKKLF